MGVFFACLMATAEAPWSQGTALVLPNERAEVGVFQALRLGLGDGREFSTQPLLNVLMPNVAVKQHWATCGDAEIASEHRLTYPTPLLRVLARDGTGGILPNDSVVPDIVAFENTLLATWRLSPTLWLTPRLGATVAARGGGGGLATIDLPLVFPRTAAFHKGWSVRAGLDADVKVGERVVVVVDADVFLLPFAAARYHVEHSGMFVVELARDTTLWLGYKIVYGRYPFGGEWHLGNSPWPFPMIDLQWAL